MSERARVKKREHIKRLGAYRLLVRKSHQHIYGSLINKDGRMMLTVSSRSEEISKKLKYGGNVSAASEVGKALAKAVLKAGVKKIAFDCGGYRYHGRVKALADGAREGGLDF
jgi:large subunit ribosomal protein L18